MAPYEILQYFRERQPAIVDSIHEIVEIESPSYDVERSLEVVRWVEAAAAEVPLDIEMTRIPAENYGEHLLIRAFPGSGKQAMLLGHTDTVHPVGTNAQNPTRIDEGRFYGCGIFDMKANIVLMLEALRFFAASGLKPARPITVLLSCDEEVGSATGRSIVEAEALRSEFCLVCERFVCACFVFYIPQTSRLRSAVFTCSSHVGFPIVPTDWRLY